jgi:hypothetical protein
VDLIPAVPKSALKLKREVETKYGENYKPAVAEISSPTPPERNYYVSRSTGLLPSVETLPIVKPSKKFAHAASSGYGPDRERIGP